MSKVTPKFQAVTCPKCGNKFTAVTGFNPQIDKNELRDLLNRYSLLKTDILRLIRLVELAENRECNDIDLYNVLKAIYTEVDGKSKFEKALTIYQDKRYFDEGKGLSYFLAIMRNMEIGNESNRATQESTQGIGREY